MPRQRTFDYDECRRLRSDQGWKLRELAERFGVSISTISYVCNPASMAKNMRAHAAWQRSGTCGKCGGARVRYNKANPRLPKDTGLCRSCWEQSTKGRG